ncbi:MAG: sulfatase-like hydrolase/transferase [Actinomycetota bacterium]
MLIGIMIAATVAVVLIAHLLVRDLARACFVATVAVGSFSAYGRVAREFGAPSDGPGRIWFLAAWLAATAVAMLVAGSVRRRAFGLTKLLNATAAILVGLNLVPIVSHAAASDHTMTAAWHLDAGGLDPAAVGPVRDVYYLIFDRYGGERTLRNLYGFDNAGFLDALEAKGFVVVRDAVANYPQTTHSLASSLNMTYLADLAGAMGETSGDWGPLRSSLRATTLSRALQSVGYRYVHIGSWWEPTWDDPTADINYVYGGFSEFTEAYWDTTMLPVISQLLGLSSAPDDRLVQWNRVHFQMEQIASTARDPGPTFTFAHFTLPHTPYVFHADGSLVENVARPSEVAYVDQLRYTNTVITDVVDDLLGTPGPAPIIVVQSDEGPHPPLYDFAGNIDWSWPEQSDTELQRKLRILEAFYLPGLSDPSAYRDTTPVNTFRMIFDDYFGADLPRLPDRVYAFADIEHPYRFVDITARVKAG